ncbi:colony stimulating factor 3 [Homo sapiens]|uniref:Colony stimulating factor 3 n=1 Tax=Homo sapiens TaxID=9606 RepID=J3QRD4_HUMAN|nr:colony stimulating factor 3 [Homo sapiens]KAI4049256.1 colony stimulating factor 3 [Homo sapiens]
MAGPATQSPMKLMVCHLQAVPPRGAGAARTLSGHPLGSPEQLPQPGPAAGRLLEPTP